MPKLDLPPDGPALTWHTMRDWLYKLWLNIKGLTFGADSSTYSSAILATAGQSDQGQMGLLGVNYSLRLQAVNTSAASIPNNTVTTVTSWTTNFDPLAGFSASTGIYTFQEPGYYLLTGMFRFSGVFAAEVSIGFDKNGLGTTRLAQSGKDGLSGGITYTAPYSTSIVTIQFFARGDTVLLWAYQNSGSSQTLGNSALANQFAIVKL